MAIYYLDSSALVKHYVREAGSGWVNQLFAPTGRHELFIAAIAPVEIVAAIARRGRGGGMTAHAVTAALAQLRAELPSRYQVVGLTDGLLTQAMVLAEHHSLRGYDAVQLAAALEVNAIGLSCGLPSLTLVSSDQELNLAAAQSGLTVEDPNSHII